MKTLLLDLDGTLTNPEAGIVGSLRFALEGLGESPPLDAELARCIGPPLSDSFQRILLTDRDDPRIERGIALYRERFDAIGWRENAVIPGIPSFLIAAKTQGFQRILATSKPTVFAQRIAEHFEFAIQLEAIYGATLDGTRSKKADVIAHALASSKIRPEDAIMVGDRKDDIEGAAEHGIPCIGVTFGFGTRDELETAGARWICDAPGEILSCLGTTL